MDKKDNPSRDTSKPTESMNAWAAQMAAFEDRLLASGRTVTAMAEPSDEEMNTFTVTFPPNRDPLALRHAFRQPKPKRIHLCEAYLATDFVFEADGKTYTMRAGEQNVDVRDLLAEHGVQGAAYLTACNPASLSLGEVHNKLAMRALRKDLKRSDKTQAVFDGEGLGRIGAWPPDPSLMVLGISRDWAEQLARRYGQYAFVWVDETGTPALVEMADLDRASRYPLRNPPFKWIELGFEWRYEWVSVRISPSQWKRILAGEEPGLKTRASNDGEEFTLYWGFDEENLYVSYGDDGGTAYDGKITGVSMSLP